MIDEYNIKEINKLYNGNICLDFGSKWGLNEIYPRSVEIIESGGLLVQVSQINSYNDKKKFDSICKFDSFTELRNLIERLLIDKSYLNLKFKNQYNFFKNKDNNYSTFSKIYEIARQANIE